MKAAFYYHIPITVLNDGYYLPGHFGIFIDELANNFDELVLIMHKANAFDNLSNDYCLKAKNIRLVNLGPTTPAWHRALFHYNILAEKVKEAADCSIIIVRAPCALAPFFYKYVSNKQTLWFMVVGDYKEGAENWATNSIRNLAIKYYLHINSFLFESKLRNYNVMVNSEKLYLKYKNKCKSLFKISTTTLRDEDFYKREDTCSDDKIRLLYTGRIDKAKGLFELIDALSIMQKEGINVQVDIAGWELKEGKQNEHELRERIIRLGINNLVNFHGKLNVGPELNALYRKSDIYVLPSFYEGFPRTIWEAGANCVPIICSNVGGIPEILKHGQTALLIEPGKPMQIVDGVKKIINNQSYRKNLIQNAYRLAQSNTLKIQTQKLADIIKSNYASQK